MPFFVDSQIGIPETKRSLLVPVSHAEYEWEIRGPKVNADVSFYFGIDGKAEFRTMDTLDQAWVLGRHAHEYRDADAVEVTRLVGMMLIAYVHQHLRRPDLPFGGYYPLGVCQDGVAAIERKMTGHDTLFPNTTEAALWDDPRDAEINAMMIAIPKDRNGAPPTPARIFGSLPVTDFKLITIPGLTADLDAVYAAWQGGSLERTRSWMEKMKLRLVGAAALVVLAGIVVWRRRRAKKRLSLIWTARDATRLRGEASYTTGRVGYEHGDERRQRRSPAKRQPKKRSKEVELRRASTALRQARMLSVR